MSVLISDAGPDVLSDVLVALRFRGRVFCRSELSAPWSIEFPRGAFAHFHLVERGQCSIRVGRDEVRIGAGDLIVLPHGRGHVLSDTTSDRPLALDKLLPRRHWGSRALIRHGGGGAQAHLLCGAFEFDGPVDHPLVVQLPDVVRVSGKDDAAGWLRATLKLVQVEARRGAPGSDLMLTHLLGVVFVHIIRAWAREHGATKWLTAIRDRQIGQALRLVHRSPEKSWSIGSLGRQVGLSRSTFAARFTSLVGEPPLAYVERWRLDLAAHLLRTTMASLEEVADRVGYSSAASLSRAFRRRFNETPGTYRRRTSSALQSILPGGRVPGIESEFPRAPQWSELAASG